MDAPPIKMPKVEVLIDFATNRINKQEENYCKIASRGHEHSLDQLTKGRMIAEFLN
jgi:hypothetical protein